jgi:hypothetical protein
MIGTLTYCLNGHYIALANKVIHVRSFHQMQVTAERASREQENLPAFCSKCGAKTVSACQHCNAEIALRYQGETVAYCGGCGKPFPWTEAALAAAKEYADELDELTSSEKTNLKAAFDEMTTDTARTPLATGRFKKLMDKIAPAAATAITKIIVSVATEEVKKQLGLTT